MLAGRRAAEAGVRVAVEGLGVFSDRRPDHLDGERVGLRVGLRAKWRQLGGDRELLIAECAYEQWHRLLFARFLAENQLLLHPQFRTPVSLAECEELAAELGEPDGWSVAARFASEILPGIFRLDDPSVRLRLAPEGRHALEEILAGIPAEVFRADDSLGWVYQFWQKDKKDEVNRSERKIGGADLGPVTQLFTENYMVRFLLENSLGAWWAARHPESLLVKGFEYLRFDEEGRPAAGTFEGWPDIVAEVTVMDPCCGSGHFLVEAFSMLWQMRAEEERIDPVVAQDAVLRDNLYGLELDPRCVQIAMFNLALQAWKAGGGWRHLPVPHVACSGIPVKAPVDEWKALAGGDERLENALVRLHILFRDADTLGSLIDPKRATEITDPTGLQTSTEDVDWDEIAPLLEKAAQRETADPATAVLGADAASIVKAADLLSRRYTLVATNPPFLGRGAQADALRAHSLEAYRGMDADLSVTMVTRWSVAAGTFTLVMPQGVLFMGAFKTTRKRWLEDHEFLVVARLGSGAFDAISGQVVQVALVVVHPFSRRSRTYLELDLSADDRGAKVEGLMAGGLTKGSQHDQLTNPGHVVAAGGGRIDAPLESAVQVREGLKAGDVNRFEVYLWEVPVRGSTWEYLQDSPGTTTSYTGRSRLVRWENESGDMAALAASVKHLNHIAQNWRRGKPLWGKRGIAFSLMGSLNATLYLGDRFSANCAAIVPNDPTEVLPLWAYAESGKWEEAVRSWHRGLAVTAHNIARVPFDVDHWRKVAEERFPKGLPEPWSDDPTQWLFEGRPEVSTAPLQVAVGRLVGYRWPAQAESEDLDGLADPDGIVCLPSVAGEAPAAERLQRLLAAAYGKDWSPALLKRLLVGSGSKKTSLAEWLRDDFFKQHCALFGNRPFVWHIWDGLKDGFSALVNYHRMDRKMLEKLTYTYLGTDWMERLKAQVREEVAGAEARLGAAQDLKSKLEKILEGEPPFDIYVRWKPLHEQSIGWEPDLNDGVRLNIRPFVEAGVLRTRFNIDWKKDRGKNPDGSERHNHLHHTLAEKRTAQTKTGKQ